MKTGASKVCREIAAISSVEIQFDLNPSGSVRWNEAEQRGNSLKLTLVITNHCTGDPAEGEEKSIAGREDLYLTKLKAEGRAEQIGLFIRN